MIPLDLSVCSLNARSLGNKLPELQVLQSTEQFHLICVTETWFHQGIRSSEIDNSKYSVVARKDRVDTCKGRGGGVLILARHDISCHEVLVNFDNICAVKVEDLVIFCCYLSPNATIESRAAMNVFFNSLSVRCVAVGDFNYPGIDWEELAGKTTTENDFIESVTLAGLSQLVNVPTHDAGNILDLVFESEQDICSDVLPRPDLQFSDHIPLTFLIAGKTSLQHPCNDKVFVFAQGNYARFKQFMENIDWISILENRTANEAWNLLKDVIIYGMKLYIPERLQRTNHRPPWLSPSLLRSIRKRNRLWKRKKIFPSETNLREFNTHKACVKRSIRSAKKHYEEGLLDSKNKKLFFDYIKNRGNPSSPVGPLLDSSDNLVTDEYLMTILLNDQFRSVFNSPIEEKEWPSFEQKCPLSTVSFSINDVMESIIKLKPSSSPGPDGIPPRIYKELDLTVARPLTMVFTICMQTSKTPLDWKVANVVPLFKGGTRTKPGNYRPISLTSVASKLMESIIKNVVLRSLEARTWFSPAQHGFRSGKSCVSNHLSFQAYVTDALEESLPVDVIYLDFAKAFDKVDHL